jgi:excisionase family DNA binding protein
MLTVPQAAARVHRSPETVRRWIRSGRLPARKVGTQHLIEEADLEQLQGADTLPLPDDWWTETPTGEPMPDVVAAVRGSRQGH